MRRFTLQEGNSAVAIGELPKGGSVTILLYNAKTAAAIGTDDDDCTEIGTSGMYTWSYSNLTSAIGVETQILWIMTESGSSRTTWGEDYFGGIFDTLGNNSAAILEDTGTTLPASLTTIEGKIDTVDGVADSILEDTGTTIPATLTTIDGIVDDILVDTGTTIPDVIGTPVVLDGALATLAGMLTKMADDNGGADFDASTDSLQAIADGESTAPTVTQIREEMDANSTKLASILEDTGTTIPGALTTIEGKIDTVDGVADDILVDTNDVVNKMESGSLAPNSVQFE